MTNPIKVLVLFFFFFFFKKNIKKQKKKEKKKNSSSLVAEQRAPSLLFLTDWPLRELIIILFFVRQKKISFQKIQNCSSISSF